MPYDYTEPKVMNVDCVWTFVHVDFLPATSYLAQYVLVKHKASYTSWIPKVHGHTKHFGSTKQHIAIEWESPLYAKSKTRHLLRMHTE